MPNHATKPSQDPDGPIIVDIPTWRLWMAHIVMGACEAAYVVSFGRVDLDACSERITDWVIAGGRAQ